MNVSHPGTEPPSSSVPKHTRKLLNESFPISIYCHFLQHNDSRITLANGDKRFIETERVLSPSIHLFCLLVVAILLSLLAEKLMSFQSLCLLERGREGEEQEGEQDQDLIIWL